MIGGDDGVDVRFAGTLAFAGGVLGVFDCGLDMVARTSSRSSATRARCSWPTRGTGARRASSCGRADGDRSRSRPRTRTRCELEDFAAAVARRAPAPVRPRGRGRPGADDRGALPRGRSRARRERPDRAREAQRHGARGRGRARRAGAAPRRRRRRRADGSGPRPAAAPAAKLQLSSYACAFISEHVPSRWRQAEHVTQLVHRHPDAQRRRIAGDPGLSITVDAAVARAPDRRREPEAALPQRASEPVAFATNTTCGARGRAPGRSHARAGAVPAAAAASTRAPEPDASKYSGRRPDGLAARRRR